MTNLKRKNLIGAGIIVFIGSVLLVSCLKDDSSALENESKIKYENLKTAYGMTSADSIGYGVYMQFIELENPYDTTRPISTDYALISYTGYDSDGKIIETSDSTTAVRKDIYYYDFIYGPSKVRVGNTLAGIYLALLHMPPNSKVNIVMPADMAYGSYTPVMYTVTLHKIVKNEIQFEKDQRKAYRNAIGFNGTYNSDSTFEYRIIKTGTVASGIEYYKKVTIILHAYYAEWIDGLLTKNPGRQFFPINKSSDTISYFYQYTTGFPLTAAIDSMVSVMKTGEEREFITSSDYTYGETGYVHPNYNYYIVPRYTSVHYILKLYSVE